MSGNCGTGSLRFVLIVALLLISVGLSSCNFVTGSAGSPSDQSGAGEVIEGNLPSDDANDDEGTLVATTGSTGTTTGDGAGEPFQGVPPIYSFWNHDFSCGQFTDVAVASIEQTSPTQYEWSNFPCSTARRSVSGIRRVKFEPSVIGYRGNPFELKTTTAPNNDGYIEAWCLSRDATDARGVSIIVRSPATDSFSAAIVVSQSAGNLVKTEPFNVERTKHTATSVRYASSQHGFTLNIVPGSNPTGTLTTTADGTDGNENMDCFIIPPPQEDKK